MNITRKELFAAAALAGFHANPEYASEDCDLLAKLALEQAEAMDELMTATDSDRVEIPHEHN